MLTGLPNRAYFEERVTSALRSASDRRLALAFIDLDGFKQVNDRYGHEVGDELLSQMSERILGLVRSTDVLARISGDEFVLLLNPVVDDASLDGVIERILRALKEPFHQIGRAHVCTPVTNAHLVCCLRLEKQNNIHTNNKQ